jgi:hypothetical protein
MDGTEKEDKIDDAQRDGSSADGRGDAAAPLSASENPHSEPSISSFSLGPAGDTSSLNHDTGSSKQPEDDDDEAVRDSQPAAVEQEQNVPKEQPDASSIKESDPSVSTPPQQEPPAAVVEPEQSSHAPAPSTAPHPGISGSTTSARPMLQEWKLKSVVFPPKAGPSTPQRSVKIIMQDENGPCSLIALCSNISLPTYLITLPR